MLPALRAPRCEQGGPPRRWWGARWKPLVAAALIAAATSERPQSGEREHRDDQLRRELSRVERLDIDPLDPLHWIDPDTSGSCAFGGARVVLRARGAGERHHDIYLVRVALSPEGQLLRSCGAYNLTETSAADEAQLTIAGSLLAWQLAAQGRTYRIESADLAGEAAPADFGPLSRWQWRLSRWQQTGQWSGIRRRSFRLEPAVSSVRLSWRETALELRGDGLAATIFDDSAPRAAARDNGARASLVEEPRAPALPGNLLTWTVDRARAIPWLGIERVQWLKAISFGALDRVEAALARAAPARAANALPLAPVAAAAPPTSPARDGSEAGLPPEPLVPHWSPALPGEGEWRSLAGDPFVKSRPGLPPLFTTTFIRPDPRRENARVVIVMWDPRRVELHFVPGTEEPKSATGEVGTGLIPREPRLLSRLVGAFNGGFQSAHGAFGARASGRLLVPPRPYAATVARFADGALGFGTWPRHSAVPDDIESFRQNLTPLVSAGTLNPYQRQWWGGAPQGWSDVTRTVRSALCLTRSKQVGYFYGSRVDHEALGRGLLMAGCDYGIHLDMNAGHTGFEFYSVLPAHAAPLPQSELATRWKAERALRELPELRFRSRRLFRNMQLMHFPRYIRRQSRDFFFLTERPLLPGSAPAAPGGALGEPQAARNSEFPHAVATASAHPDPARPATQVRLIEVDLKWVSAAVGAALPVPSDAVLSLAVPGGSTARRALWVAGHRGRIGIPETGAHVLAHESEDGRESAAWGVRDQQIAIYAEVVSGKDPDLDPALLERVLAERGADERMLAAPPAFLRCASARCLGEGDGPPATAVSRDHPALHFRRDAWQALRTLFSDTEIVTPEAWQPYQP